MGGKIQGCISNATQWQVKYIIRQTMLQTKGATVVTDWNVGGSLSGDYAKKIGYKDGKGEVDIGGKVAANINGGFANKNTTEINRIEAKGAIIITPGSSSRSGFQFKATQQNPRYLSIWVQHPTKGDILLMENMRVETEKDMRKCIWVDTNGRLKISQLAQEPNTWRFALGCGQQRNYPPGHACTQCKKNQSCANGCTQKNKYGGAFQQELSNNNLNPQTQIVKKCKNVIKNYLKTFKQNQIPEIINTLLTRFEQCSTMREINFEIDQALSRIQKNQRCCNKFKQSTNYGIQTSTQWMCSTCFFDNSYSSWSYERDERFDCCRCLMWTCGGFAVLPLLCSFCCLFKCCTSCCLDSQKKYKQLDPRQIVQALQQRIKLVE